MRRTENPAVGPGPAPGPGAVLASGEILFLASGQGLPLTLERPRRRPASRGKGGGEGTTQKFQRGLRNLPNPAPSPGPEAALWGWGGVHVPVPASCPQDRGGLPDSRSVPGRGHWGPRVRRSAPGPTSPRGGAAPQPQFPPTVPAAASAPPTLPAVRGGAPQIRGRRLGFRRGGAGASGLGAAGPSRRPGLGGGTEALGASCSVGGGSRGGNSPQPEAGEVRGSQSLWLLPSVGAAAPRGRCGRQGGGRKRSHPRSPVPAVPAAPSSPARPPFPTPGPAEAARVSPVSPPAGRWGAGGRRDPRRRRRELPRGRARVGGSLPTLPSQKVPAWRVGVLFALGSSLPVLLGWGSVPGKNHLPPSRLQAPAAESLLGEVGAGCPLFLSPLATTRRGLGELGGSNHRRP